MRLIPNFFFLFLLIGLFAPYVQAASIAIEQGTTLGPTNITNASINATANFSADIIIVDNYFIQIENFTSYNSIGYFIVHLINITQTNTTISSGDFPIFSDANENSITTINNYNVTFNASFNHTTSTIPSSPRQLYPNGTHQTLTYTYAGGVFSAQGVEIPPGVSVIELRPGFPPNAPTDAVCQTGMNSVERGLLFAGVIGAFVFGVVMLMMGGITPASMLLLSIAILLMGVALNAVCW